MSERDFSLAQCVLGYASLTPSLATHTLSLQHQHPRLTIQTRLTVYSHTSSIKGLPMLSYCASSYNHKHNNSYNSKHNQKQPSTKQISYLTITPSNLAKMCFEIGVIFEYNCGCKKELTEFTECNTKKFGLMCANTKRKGQTEKIPAGCAKGGHW